MDSGLSYEDAVQKIKEELGARNKEDEFFQEFFNDIDTALETEVPGSKDVKKLWKQLVQKYHPDLAKNPTEKKKREQIMKMINKAYKSNDLDTLQDIEEKHVIEHLDFANITILKKAFVSLENQIIKIQKDYKDLKLSTWYSWLKKPQLEREKLFANLETQILEDIILKRKTLLQLKKKHNLP